MSGFGRDIFTNLPIKTASASALSKSPLQPYAFARPAFDPKTGTMSQQFLYVQFKVTPKGTLTRATCSETVAIELPAKHVADWKLQSPGRYLTDDEIAIELTQGIAIAVAGRFVVLTGDPLKEREIHSARFLPERLPIMNERDCDYEDNAIL
ncbi:MAG TPA: hypothetical protein VN843_18320 [Anaerolineales bacterium]|nr:hypothetical protein [Anaerolineales bacterium]